MMILANAINTNGTETFRIDLNEKKKHLVQ